MRLNALAASLIVNVDYCVDYHSLLVDDPDEDGYDSDKVDEALLVDDKHYDIDYTGGYVSVRLRMPEERKEHWEEFKCNLILNEVKALADLILPRVEEKPNTLRVIKEMSYNVPRKTLASVVLNVPEYDDYDPKAFFLKLVDDATNKKGLWAPGAAEKAKLRTAYYFLEDEHKTECNFMRILADLRSMILTLAKDDPTMEDFSEEDFLKRKKMISAVRPAVFSFANAELDGNFYRLLAKADADLTEKQRKINLYESHFLTFVLEIALQFDKRKRKLMKLDIERKRKEAEESAESGEDQRKKIRAE